MTTTYAQIETVTVSPDVLEFHEDAFQNMAVVREIVACGLFRLPIVVRESSADGALRIVDGHHRAELARQAGEDIEAVLVPFATYEAMQAAGFDAIEIAFAACVAAEEDDAAEGIRGQFPYRLAQFSRAAEALAELL